MWLLSGLLFGVGCADVLIQGSAQKGPFLLGTSVTASAVDRAGDPAGAAYATTTDEAGAFEIAAPEGTRLRAEATGYFFDEVRGQLSGRPVALRAWFQADDALPARMNVATHLGSERVLARMSDGEGLRDAVSQADGELVAALGIGPTGFALEDPSTALDLLDVDPDDAWLLAVSAVLLQAAIARAGSDGPVEANAQELLDALSQDLADDGALTATHVAELAAAERAVDVPSVEANLAAWSAEIGGSGRVADLDTMIDNDGDALVNAADNCPFVANVDQADLDADGVGDACGCGNGTDDDGELCLTRTQTWALGPSSGLGLVGLADVDNDGDVDAIVDTIGLSVLHNEGNGTFETEPERMTDDGVFARAAVLADVEPDGDVDVVFSGGAGAGIGVLVNDGTGAFGLTVIDRGPSTSYLAVGEFDDAAGLDILVARVLDPLDSSDNDALQVWSGTGAGGFVLGLEQWVEAYFTPQIARDLNEDGRADVVAMALGLGSPMLFLSGDDGSFHPYTPDFGDSCTYVGSYDPRSVFDIDGAAGPDVFVYVFDACAYTTEAAVMFSPDFDALGGRADGPIGFVQAVDLGGDGGQDFVADQHFVDQGLVRLGITPTAVGIGDSTPFTEQGYTAYADLDGDGDDDALRLGYSTRAEVWLNTP